MTKGLKPNQKKYSKEEHQKDDMKWDKAKQESSMKREITPKKISNKHFWFQKVEEQTLKKRFPMIPESVVGVCIDLLGHVAKEQYSG